MCSSDLGTYNLFAHSLSNQGIQCRFVDHDDLDALEAAIDDNTRALYCESIGNPAGNIRSSPGASRWRS